METFETGVSNDWNYKSFNRKEIMAPNETPKQPPDTQNFTDESLRTYPSLPPPVNSHPIRIKIHNEQHLNIYDREGGKDLVR